MQILIVGAGAVGLTYGLCFRKGGADVSFLVKPAHVAALKDGVTMLRHNLLLPGLKAQQFVDYDMYDDLTRVPLGNYDQVWVTVPSNALSDDWLATLRDGMRDDAALIGLQPGPKDDDRLRGFFGDRFVKGVIGFLAYQYPMPGMTDAKGRSGIAYLLPPGAGGLGPTNHPAAHAAQNILERGGMKVSLSDNLAEQYGRVSALSLTHMAGLELAGWSFKGFRDGAGDGRTLARAAAQEALAIVAHQFGQDFDAKSAARMTGLAPLVTRIAPMVPSLRLEPYLAFHFGKVAPQTRTVIRDFIALARDANLSSSALQDLLAALEQLDQAG